MNKIEDACKTLSNSFKNPNEFESWKKEREEHAIREKEWKTKHDFIDWVMYKKVIANIRRRSLIQFPEGDCASIDNMALKNSGVDLEKLDALIDDELLNHLNIYFYNTKIDIYHLSSFIYAVDSVRFFKKGNFSTDVKEFKREIAILKKQADKLQFFSPKQIRIKLPQLPQDIIFTMIKKFRRYGLKEEEIRCFHDFFEDRKRLPKKTKSYQERLDTWDRIVKEEREKDTHFYTLGMHIAAETIHWYSPNIELRYDNTSLRYKDTKKLSRVKT